MEDLYLIFGLAWFVGGLMAGLTGFGGAMVALPITISYLPPTAVMPITIIAVIALVSYMAYLYREALDVKSAVALAIGSIPGSIIGAYVLLFISMQAIQIFAGLVMLVFVFMQFTPKFTITIKETMPKTLVTGFITGFLNTTVTFAGPSIAIYALLLNWGKEKFLGVVSLATLLTSLGTVVVYGVNNLYTKEMIPLLAVVIPATLIGIALAYPLGRRINTQVYRKIVIAIIFFAACTCLYRGFGFTL